MINPKARFILPANANAIRNLTIIIIITCVYIALNTRFLSAEHEVNDNKKKTIKNGMK